jgi:hypothetical protein
MQTVRNHVNVGCRRRARVIAEGGFLGRGRRQLAQLGHRGVWIVRAKN